MTAALTPFFTASTQVSTFGIIPPEIVPLLINFLTSGILIWVNKLPFLSNTPLTSVNRISLSDKIDAEIAESVKNALEAPEPPSHELTKYIWAED